MTDRHDIPSHGGSLGPIPPDPRRRLLELLTTLAFQEREVTLASGRKSNFYIDCKEVTLDAEGSALVGAALFDQVCRYERASSATVAALGGLTLGADPIATAVSVVSYLRGRPLPAFIVRKEAKGHGTGRYLEGASRLPPNAELVVVEDVVTTGGSAIQAIRRVRDQGFLVSRVFALVDRTEGGREALEGEDVVLDALFTKADFLAGT